MVAVSSKRNKKKTAAKAPVKRGGAREVVRLERGEDDKNGAFWEITRSGSTIVTRSGKHLSAGRRVVKEWDDSASAKAAFASAVAAKRAEGYAEPAPKPEIGAASRSGVAARNADLEASIMASPNEAQGYLVYADWLQQQGDPRGELIIVQHGLADRTKDPRELDKLDVMERELFEKFAPELLGELRPHLRVRDDKRYIRGLAWRAGFIRAARLTPAWSPGPLFMSSALKKLLMHPSSRFLEHLVLDSFASEDDVRKTVKLLETKAPPTLRSLVGEWYAYAGLAPIAKALPQVRRATLGRAMTFGATSHLEHIEEVFARDSFIEALRTSDLPSLRKLRLTVLSHDGDLPLDRAPILEELRVQKWIEREGIPINQSAYAHRIIDVALQKKLTCLELEIPFDVEGIKRLVGRVAELRTIPKLRLVKVAIPDAASRSELQSGLPNLEWLPLPEEIEIGDIEPLHHAPLA